MSDSVQQFDVAIIGGGVIGCSIAWRLAQARMSVVVVERGDIGREASHAAGGMLAPLAEADAADEFFHFAVKSRALYAEFARELKEASGQDIEYRTEGTLYLSLTEEDDEELDHRWQWQHANGLNVKRLNAGCVRKLEPAINSTLRWGLKFPDDHQVNNRRLTKALETAARKAGVTFQTYNEITSILVDGLCVYGLETQRGNLKAHVVIVAAGSWSTQRLASADMQEFHITPVRGQMVAMEMQAAPIQHVIYSRRGYLIPRLNGHLIAGSTTEFVGYDKRVTAGGIRSILERAEEIVPALADQAIVETWAGLRPKPPSETGSVSWPILGESQHTKGLIYATGHYRNGILLTPITAQAISELVLCGESSINLQPFSPRRFNVLLSPGATRKIAQSGS